MDRTKQDAQDAGCSIRAMSPIYYLNIRAKAQTKLEGW